MKLIILERSGAGKLLCKGRPHVQHVVSIGSASEPPPACYGHYPARKLRLVFDDYDTEHPDAPQWEHVQAIIRFAEGVGPDDTVLVHCFAGISRSGAAGLIVLSTMLGPGREAEAVRAVRSIDPVIFPNARMIAMADMLLGRSGILFGAYSASWRRLA